jgi:hypothetical protein
MEDRGIAAIEKAAHEYVDARDARMSMGEEEQRRHTKLIAVMRANGKTTYVHRNGDEVIDVKVTPKDATAKARVKIVAAEDYKPEGQRGPRTEEPEIAGDEPELDLDENGDDDDDDQDDDSGDEGDDDLDEEEGDEA